MGEREGQKEGVQMGKTRGPSPDQVQVDLKVQIKILILPVNSLTKVYGPPTTIYCKW